MVFVFTDLRVLFMLSYEHVIIMVNVIYTNLLHYPTLLSKPPQHIPPITTHQVVWSTWCFISQNLSNGYNSQDLIDIQLLKIGNSGPT